MSKDADIRWTGEFTCQENERAYRQSQAEQEIRQMRLIWSLALACFFVYGLADLASANTRSDQLLAPRLGILGAGLPVLLATFTVTGRRHRDALASLALIMALSCYGAMIGLRPGTSTGALLLLLVGSYLFSPCRYALHVATGILGSAAAVGVALTVSAGKVAAWQEFSYLLPANLLAAIALAQANRARRLLFWRGRALSKEVDQRRAAQARLANANRRNLRLLYNTLPREVARQLRADPARRVARELPQVAVLFTDIVGFSHLARRQSARELVDMLNALFISFDRLALRYGVEKIKTVGDAYLAVAGLDGRGASAGQAARMALRQLSEARRIGAELGVPLSLRIGLHAGPVVAGVLGTHRYAFDVWGKSVNIACRLQAAAPVGGILVSAAARDVCPEEMRFGSPRELELRGCGPVCASVLEADLSVAQLGSDAGGDGLG
jgi:class 3 adenylate cyclase